MATLTREQLMAYKSPEPLEEDYALPEMGGTVHIKGLIRKADREEIGKARKTLQEAQKSLRQVLRLDYDPDEDDIAAACWAAACITDPKMTPEDWLQFANQGYSLLGKLWIRSLICSRVIPDVEENDPETVTVPDGVTAARAELEGMQANDPLDSGGGSTATE